MTAADRLHVAAHRLRGDRADADPVRRGLLGVLVEAFVPRRRRHLVQLTLSLLAVLAALVMVVLSADAPAGHRRRGAVPSTGPPCSCRARILVLGVDRRCCWSASGRWSAAARSSPRPRSPPVGRATAEQAAGRNGATEVFPLIAFAIGGMLLFVAANDLLTMFVALEVFSLPLYLLCALARRRRLL